MAGRVKKPYELRAGIGRDIRLVGRFDTYAEADAMWVRITKRSSAIMGRIDRLPWWRRLL